MRKAGRSPACKPLPAMKMTMKYFWSIVLLIALASCHENTLKDKKETISEKKDIILEVNDEIADTQYTATTQISVMVIPCSNGYDYNLKMGDVNPSLEKYLGQDDRIVLKPFPLKEMKGSGYLGVYDKKHCDNILERVDVDFLIMTRMKGIDISSANGEAGNWGYDTKILNVESMVQFDGISARKLKTFELIDSDVKSKTNELINLIIKSRNE